MNIDDRFRNTKDKYFQEGDSINLNELSCNSKITSTTIDLIDNNNNNDHKNFENPLSIVDDNNQNYDRKDEELIEDDPQLNLIAASDSDISFHVRAKNLIIETNEGSRYRAFNIKNKVYKTKSDIEEELEEVMDRIHHAASLMEQANRVKSKNSIIYPNEVKKLPTEADKRIYFESFKKRTIRLVLFTRTLENKILEYKAHLNHLNKLLANFNNNNTLEDNKNDLNSCAADEVGKIQQEDNNEDCFELNTNLLESHSYEYKPTNFIINSVNYYLLMLLYLFKPPFDGSKSEIFSYLKRIMLILFVLFMIFYIILASGELYEYTHELLFPKPKPPPHWFDYYKTEIWNIMLDIIDWN